jgi:hypothetical protein
VTGDRWTRPKPSDGAPPPSYAQLQMEQLFCWECLELADERAEGWRAYRCDVPGEDAEPIVRIYCPDCAKREFGPLAGAGETAESAGS